MSCNPPPLIDIVRATITALADSSGMSEAEILCHATNKTSQSEIAGLTWRLIESAGYATTEEICRLFGQSDEVVHRCLLKHDDPKMFLFLLNRITELIAKQVADEIQGHAEYWKHRASAAEQKLQLANVELSHVRQIAEQGGSWELIEKYLDETGHG